MLRRYRKEDIPAIVSLEKETLGTTLGEEMLTSDLTNAMAYYFVYEEDNQILGYISVTFDGFQGEILNFAVRKDHQGKGIGTKLICHAIDECFSKGADSFILEVRRSNEKAIGLYTKLGFKEISVRKAYYSNGEDALVLLKQMIPFMDIEDAYLQIFCKFEEHKDYTYIHSDTHPTKYYFNFYRVKNPDCIDHLLGIRKDFLQLELHEPYQGMYDCPEKCGEIRYHTSIFTFYPLRDKKYTVKKLDKFQYSLFEGFMYLDSLQYGERFAKDNVREFLDAKFKKNKLDWYIVYDGGVIVGTISAFIYQDALMLEDFFILDEYQRQGYGSALLAYAIEDSKSRGVHDVYLTAEAEDSVNEMYQRMGLKEVGHDYVVREVFE